MTAARSERPPPEKEGSPGKGSNLNNSSKQQISNGQRHRQPSLMAPRNTGVTVPASQSYQR
jgi:hypothetical protein